MTGAPSDAAVEAGAASAADEALPGDLEAQVLPGIRRLRLPMPYELDHVNVWRLDDGDGFALVDTGLRTDRVASIWRSYFDAQPGHACLTRVFVTHLHPDHVGMAGWLTRRYGVALWMTRLEYLTCRVMAADAGREAPADAIRFYRRAGWSDAAIDRYRARFGNFGKHIHPLPDSFRRLGDGDELRIGGQLWRVVVGSGHSPEHACLYAPDLRALISGDQVLPRVSSNVSVNPQEPEADPLADWLASLDRIALTVPDDVLVLPSHDECFHGLHARLNALKARQTSRLDRLRVLLARPCRVVDTFATLFARPVGDDDIQRLGMATGEAAACLNHLLVRRETTCRFDDDGVALHQRIG